MSESPLPPRRYGPPARGVTASDVERAADALLREGERPTIDKIRARLGTGSPNTITPLLDAWWKRLANRLDAGPAALHRLPEPIAHIAEALWMQALDQGRRRATQEQSNATRALATDQQAFELRSHVLSLREAELDARLRDRERTQAALEAQVQELTLMLRKELATRAAQAHRIAALEAQLLARSTTAPNVMPRKTARPPKPKGTPPRLTAKPARRSATKTRQPTTRKAPGRRSPRR